MYEKNDARDTLIANVSMPGLLLVLYSTVVPTVVRAMWAIRESTLRLLKTVVDMVPVPSILKMASSPGNI